MEHAIIGKIVYEGYDEIQHHSYGTFETGLISEWDEYVSHDDSERPLTDSEDDLELLHMYFADALDYVDRRGYLKTHTFEQVVDDMAWNMWDDPAGHVKLNEAGRELLRQYLKKHM